MGRPGLSGPRTALALLALLAAGCGAPPALPEGMPGPAAETPAPSPSPAGPAEAPAERQPLTAATQPVVLEAPERQSSPTAAPPGVRLPPARLVISQPGPGSMVTSPFQLVGRGGPSWDNRVRVRLLGEDGRVLAQRNTALWGPRGATGAILVELAFDLPGVAEIGRLEVATFDPRTTRISHVTTQDVVLLTAGRALVLPAIVGPERLAIVTPRDGGTVEGGRIFVRGGGWMTTEAPLTLALTDRIGEVLASAQVELEAPAVGLAGTFEGELSYAVPWAQWARLAVFEMAPEGEGFLHYSSIEVFLLP